MITTTRSTHRVIYASGHRVPFERDAQPKVGDVVFIIGRNAIYGVFGKVVDEVVTAEDWRPEGLGTPLLPKGSEGLLIEYEEPPDAEHPRTTWFDQVHAERWNIRVVAEHHPRCSICDVVWPCRKHRHERELKSQESARRNRCAHCGKDTSAAWKRERFTVDGNEWTIHTRQGPCLTAWKRYQRDGTLPKQVVEANEPPVDAPKFEGLRLVE